MYSKEFLAKWERLDRAAARLICCQPIDMSERANELELARISLRDYIRSPPSCPAANEEDALEGNPYMANSGINLGEAAALQRKEIIGQRNEICSAFMAKYGVADPVDVEQVIEHRLGSTVWYIRRKSKA